MSDIQRVGIVGCGIMGSGIADVCARRDVDVLVAVASPASAEAGRKRVAGSLGKGMRKGTVTEQERDAALSRIRFTTDLGDLADRQLVIEAVREHEPTKLEIFATLDKVVDDPDAILASNTSAIPIIRLARATGRAAQVIGVHFFNPVTALPLVELVGSLLTAPQTRERAGAFVTTVLGKQVVAAPDRAGFVVNALLIPYLVSAIRMAEAGLVTVEAIDSAMTLGCAHPVGPLRLADMIGLDTVASIASSLYEESHDPKVAPPPLLLRMVEAGLLGKKSGQGFYAY
ncbi:3-hydroxybutyryl-CoA dehydrogenase [Dactylosporangium sp. NPDC051485]|uniref:3-hydroxybutyryl-CoA dehydrogenase n=1 Tax=Dactylosporangium sp. NPDC051485 TaxID=3154846 RepID=UPI00343125AF